MPADLKQNIFYTVLFIFMHNFAAIFYGIGIALSALLLFMRPSRWGILLLFGFIILLFGFEYNKHIVEPLKDQTLNSLITVQEHNKVRRAVNLVLVKGLPRGLPLLGWTLVTGGVGLYIFSRTNKKSRKN
ncbi:hypothetical protein A3C28_04745 [Candidatus Roizmanbacteria bacterium RIFCSPHIGHO2_02_FULL_39_9]|nr:MAG: hypothetical protein A3C28_04745 [Candidatus Roizmanbacteria bacterium RIFCSPHIGHO2_02_FULL_39_9]